MAKYTTDAIFGKIGIYEIRNTLTNLVYVGSSSNLGQRASSHFRKLATNKHSNRHLQYDYDCQGAAVFQFLVLEYCTVEDLIERERHWIKELNAAQVGTGYNCKANPARHNISAESRRRLSAAVTGFRHSEETKQKISESSKGRIRSEDHCRNLSIANKGQVPWSKGKPQSDYQKKRVSEALKGNKHFAGKSHSEETLKKMSDAQKLRYQKSGGFSQESRAKVSRANRKYWTAERRAAHSELLQKYHAKKRDYNEDVEE